LEGDGSTKAVVEMQRGAEKKARTTIMEVGRGRNLLLPLIASLLEVEGGEGMVCWLAWCMEAGEPGCVCCGKGKGE
jgi:hypothetical protein